MILKIIMTVVLVVMCVMGGYLFEKVHEGEWPDGILTGLCLAAPIEAIIYAIWQS